MIRAMTFFRVKKNTFVSEKLWSRSKLINRQGRRKDDSVRMSG